MLKLPVLNKDDSVKVHVSKLVEESQELVEALYENDDIHIAEEALDTIQVCIGILDMLSTKHRLDIGQAVFRHRKKLIQERNWEVKSWVSFSIKRN